MTRSYPDTAAAYVIAGDLLARQVLTPRTAADLLPLSEWAEPRRRHMTPQTVAANHALHVRSSADDLRRALWEAAQWEADPMGRLAALADVEDAARALLAAIGEGEE